jgi:hypothetical protein
MWLCGYVLKCLCACAYVCVMCGSVDVDVWCVDSYHDRCLRILAPILPLKTNDPQARKKHAQVAHHIDKNVYM